MIYTKGTIRKAKTDDVFYVLVSSKISDGEDWAIASDEISASRDSADIAVRKIADSTQTRDAFEPFDTCMTWMFLLRPAPQRERQYIGTAGEGSTS